jgi:hypothetical protein
MIPSTHPVAQSAWPAASPVASYQIFVKLLPPKSLPSPNLKPSPTSRAGVRTVHTAQCTRTPPTPREHLPRYH